MVFPRQRLFGKNFRRGRWLALALASCTMLALAAGDAAAQSNSSWSWWPFGHSSTASPPPPTDDAIDLNSKHEAGAEVYTAVADLYIKSGKFTEAEAEYKKAIEKFPKDVRVLLGYAMLKDQMHEAAEALKLYREAERKHPDQPVVYNNLAMHYVQAEMLPEAIEAARHAVRLAPHEPRYRNNLAVLLVQAGMLKDAYQQLREVYDEPVAHYDLGYLLNKRGMKAAALQEFTIALQLNPRMALARQWVERLARERGDFIPAATSIGGMQSPYPPAPGPAPMGQPAAVPAAPAAPLPPQYAAGPQYPPPAAQYAGLATQAPVANFAPPVPAQPLPPQNVPLAPNPPLGMQAPAGNPPQFVIQPLPPPPNSPFMPQGAPPNPAFFAAQQTLPPQGGPQAVSDNSLPLVAYRDPHATGVPLAPAATQGAGLSRLPPVNEPQNPEAGQQGETVAPDPPTWRR